MLKKKIQSRALLSNKRAREEWLVNRLGKLSSKLLLREMILFLFQAIKAAKDKSLNKSKNKSNKNKIN